MANRKFFVPVDESGWEREIVEAMNAPINPFWEYEKVFYLMKRVADQFIGEGQYHFIELNKRIGVKSNDGTRTFPIKHLVVINNPKRLSSLINKLNKNLKTGL